MSAPVQMIWAIVNEQDFRRGAGLRPQHPNRQPTEVASKKEESPDTNEITMIEHFHSLWAAKGGEDSREGRRQKTASRLVCIVPCCCMLCYRTIPYINRTVATLSRAMICAFLINYTYSLSIGGTYLYRSHSRQQELNVGSSVFVGLCRSPFVR